MAYLTSSTLEENWLAQEGPEERANWVKERLLLKKSVKDWAEHFNSPSEGKRSLYFSSWGAWIPASAPQSFPAPLLCLAGEQQDHGQLQLCQPALFSPPWLPSYWAWGGLQGFPRWRYCYLSKVAVLFGPTLLALSINLATWPRFWF